MTDPHDDDRPIGEVLTRRAAVKLLSAGGTASMLAFAGIVPAARSTSSQGRANAACVVRPEMTEGPYFVDTKLNRSDIRDGKVGQPLALALTVIDATGGLCRPLPDAMVDVWQCDAKGVYSGVSDPMQGFETRNEKFLRGYQTTDSNGIARFTTIYPGWYPGRTVHIHFKVRAQAAAGAYEFTSQWYFDEGLNEQILAGGDYARPGRRDTLNANDSIFRNGGDQLLLAPAQSATGLSTSYVLGLDLADAAVGRSDGSGRGGRGRRGRG
jgi:protocatechuate 3,4-dioxygenase beta subunit